MKRIFLLLTAALLPAALNVFAADSDYTVDADGVITKYSGWDTELVIPSAIGGKTITAIGKEAFLNAELTSITIPDGITSIGEDAFRDNKLTGITIPGSVKSIGSRAFWGNEDIAAIVLSEGVEYDYGAFSSHKADVTITLPSTIRVVDSIFSSQGGEYTRAYGQNASFILAANINAAFSGSISYIANDRKAGTYTAESMKYHEKTADGYRYYETPYGAILTVWGGNTTRVRIPAEIGGIPVKALLGAFNTGYSGINKIDAVQIPETVTYIGKQTFAGQPLVSITIPKNVTYIGDGAFWRNKLTSVTIPEGVTYIGDEAFFENQLTSLTIPGKVDYIGSLAFTGNKLTSVTIPHGVTYLGALAFADMGITAITIPPSVKTVVWNPLFGNYAGNYYNAVNGTSIVIGADTAVIGKKNYDGYEENSFTRAYDKNGRKAGRYTFDSSAWDGEKWSYSAK
jgi:hypothetical protein